MAFEVYPIGSITTHTDFPENLEEVVRTTVEIASDIRNVYEHVSSQAGRIVAGHLVNSPFVPGVTRGETLYLVAEIPDTTEDASENVEQITIDEFINNERATYGVQTSWTTIKRIIRENDDFPLKLEVNENSEETLVGNIDEAVRWLEKRSRSVKNNVYYNILKDISHKRQAKRRFPAQ